MEKRIISSSLILGKSTARNLHNILRDVFNKMLVVHVDMYAVYHRKNIKNNM